MAYWAALSLGVRMWAGRMVNVPYSVSDGQRLNRFFILSVPIIALETEGRNCFYHSMSLNLNGWDSLPDGANVLDDDEHNVTIAHMNHISSGASGSLGASSPAAGVVKMALERKGIVRCVTIPDDLSMQTVCRFAGRCVSSQRKRSAHEQQSRRPQVSRRARLFDGPRARVQARPVLETHTRRSRSTPMRSSSDKMKTVVFIVCGGYKVSMDEMVQYDSLVKASLQRPEQEWEVKCNGERWWVD